MIVKLSKIIQDNQTIPHQWRMTFATQFLGGITRPGSKGLISARCYCTGTPLMIICGKFTIKFQYRHNFFWFLDTIARQNANKFAFALDLFVSLASP